MVYIFNNGYISEFVARGLRFTKTQQAPSQEIELDPFEIKYNSKTGKATINDITPKPEGNKSEINKLPEAQ